MMNSPLPPTPGPMPSLTANGAMANPTPQAANPQSLQDLMSDGFYLLLLLKRGQLPHDAESFVQMVQKFLDGVERNAMRLGVASEDVYAAKYAFCAAVDEAILSQPSPLHETWERNPLQLRLFGEHLAGEHFFDRLEELRRQGAARLPSLEVYHYCLLMGFEGKYRLEGTEKLGYLTARPPSRFTRPYTAGARSGGAPEFAEAPCLSTAAGQTGLRHSFIARKRNSAQGTVSGSAINIKPSPADDTWMMNALRKLGSTEV